jgi:hypothetical protein
VKRLRYDVYPLTPAMAESRALLVKMLSDDQRTFLRKCLREYGLERTIGILEELKAREKEPTECESPLCS